VLPALVLLSLFGVSVRSLSALNSIPDGARTIQATGQQASWEFDYPNTSVKSMNDLRVPVGQPVVLEVTSRDAVHNFWVPELFGQVEASPGTVNRASFTAEQAGLYRGVCTGLCGEGRDDLLFNVTAMEPAEFE